MKRSSLYKYYRFGYNYYFLLNDAEGITYSTATRNLVEYRDFLKEQSLKVTLKMVDYKIEDLLKRLMKENEDDIISDEHQEEIHKLLDNSDSSLDSELQLTQVYQVTKKKLDIDGLLSGGKDFLAVNALNYMTKQSFLDYQYGCRCVALTVSTASAFHLMRCIEESLKELYYAYFRTNRLPDNKQMWGNLVTYLRNKPKSPKPKVDLLDNLDMFRRNYRNPTQHPDKNYNIEEAQNLLLSVIVLLSEIYNDKQILKYAKKR